MVITAFSRLVVWGDKVHFSVHTNKPSPCVPASHWKLIFYLQLQIDLDRSILRPFHQASENREAGREGWGTSTLPPSVGGAGALVIFQWLGRNNVKAEPWVTQEGRWVPWSRATFHISLQKTPSPAHQPHLDFCRVNKEFLLLSGRH